jgi:hypothetical protein
MDFAYTYQKGMDHKTPGTSGEDEVFDTCGTRLRSYEAMKLFIPDYWYGILAIQLE